MSTEADLQSKLLNAIKAEADIERQLVAIEIVTDMYQVYLGPQVETMSARESAVVISEIDHPELEKVDCNFKVVYEDLELRLMEASDLLAETQLEIEGHDRRYGTNILRSFLLLGAILMNFS